MDLDLPVFRYHPDPIASGSIVASGAQCVCCEQRRGFIYAGPSYCEVELDDALCPWCIADGSAHEKFGASFVDEALFPDDISPEIVEEIAFRTPGFSGWQQERWPACCRRGGCAPRRRRKRRGRACDSELAYIDTQIAALD